MDQRRLQVWFRTIPAPCPKPVWCNSARSEAQPRRSTRSPAERRWAHGAPPLLHARQRFPRLLQTKTSTNIFLSLGDCEIELSDSFNQHRYNKSGHAGEDCGQRYELERVGREHRCCDYNVTQYKLRHPPLRPASGGRKLNDGSSRVFQPTVTE